MLKHSIRENGILIRSSQKIIISIRTRKQYLTQNVFKLKVGKKSKSNPAGYRPLTQSKLIFVLDHLAM
jgi:hypothetical protein